MAYVTIDDTDIQYGVICFDADGKDRTESSGLISERLIEKTKSDAITDVFFFCHGWKGDVPAAIEQYDRWIKAFAKSNDRQQATRMMPAFQPQFIGLHWPSLPFGDEEVSRAGFAGTTGTLRTEQMVELYVGRLGGAKELRVPLETIFAEARRNSFPAELPAVRWAACWAA